MGKKSKEDRKSQTEPKLKESSGSATNYKYYFFLFIFMFPSLAWIISVTGDVFNNIGGVFGGLANGMIISAPIILPILIAIYSKKLRGFMLKGVLPVAVAVLIFPSIQVYLCSPVYLKNEDLGTKHSLQATADKFLKDSCLEHCLNPSKIPSAYQLSLFTPRVAIRVYNRQILDFNLTTSARVGGKVVKVAKLLLLLSWRKVKGKYHGINLIARIPLKVKNLDQALKDKNDMILSGKVITMPNEMKKLRSGLEQQRRFVRPIILDVFRITPIEAETAHEKPKEKEEKKKENKAKNTTKEESKQEEEPKPQENVNEEAASEEEEIKEEDYVPVDDEEEEIQVEE